MVFKIKIITNGQLLVAATNSEVDDDSIALNETRETPNVLLYGYDLAGGVWERIQTDGSGKIRIKST